MRSPRLFASAALLLSACGSPAAAPPPPDPPTVAAPAMAWLAAGSPPVAPPDVPWIESGTPITRACALGWAARSEGCAPWADALTACEGATIRVPGEAACRPLSSPCPAGGFATDVPAGTLYVRAGAAAGGDGTVGLPFATIAEALVVAGPGATIALSTGTHDVSGAIDLDVSLRGACASETVLETATSARFTVETDVAIADLTLRPGDANDPIWVEGVHDVSISRVLVSGGHGHGITASAGAHVTLTDVRVEDVDVRTDATPPWSAGIVAQGSAVLEGARVVVDGATWVGASADGGRITLTDSVLRGTHEDPALPDSAGVTCWSNGTVALTRTVLESNVSRGVEVLAGCIGTTLTDVVVSRTQRGASGLAYGMAVGGPLVANGVGLFDNAESAVVTIEAGRSELSDLVVDGISGEGTGLGATYGAVVVVHRGVVRGGTAALYTAEDGTIEADDLLVDHVEGAAVLEVGGTVTLRGAHLHDVDTGLFAGGTTASIVASDVLVERVGAPGQADSDALTARAGARVEVQRAIVRDAMGTAVAAVQPDAIVIVSDLAVSGGGVGLIAFSGTVEITRADIDGPAETGVGSLSAGSRLVLTDVRVHDVVTRGPRTGAALTVDDGGALELHGVLVERAAFGLVASVSSTEQPTPSVAWSDGVIREVTGPAIDLGSAMADLSRLRVESAGDAGLIARGSAVRVALADIAISGLVGRTDDRLGRGIHVATGAHVEGSRIRIDGALGVGLLAADPGTEVTLGDVWITDTHEEACGPSCADRAAGHGVASLFEAELTLTRFRVSSSAWAGLLVAEDGVITAMDGYVDQNRVGRAVIGGAPTRLVESMVVYVDNATTETRDDVVIPPASLL